MKNLKLFVFALCLLTMSLVTVFAAGTDCENKALSVDLGSGKVACVDTFTEALNRIEADKSAEIVLKDDFVLPGYVTLNKDVTVNLGGHTMTIGKEWNFTIEGADVTFKNGTIEVVKEGRTNNVFSVNSATEESKLTLNVKVESETTTPIVKVTDATKKTEVNINNTWNVKGELVDCDNGDKKNLTINLNATVTATGLNGSNAALVSLDAGSTVVNVNGGSYTSNAYVFYLKNGELNVKAGTLTSTNHETIVVAKAGENKTTVLNITGGNIVSNKTYSLKFGDGTSAKTGTYSIAGGTFTSGKDEKGNQLPAMFINDQKFLENHPAIISKGVFTGSIVGDVTVGDQIYQKAAEAAKILVGNATVSEKDGVVTVGGTHTDTETGKKPEEQAPNTFDAGLTYVGLALSAIGASVVSVRKLKNN